MYKGEVAGPIPHLRSSISLIDALAKRKSTFR